MLCVLSLQAQRNPYLVSGQVISSATKLPLSNVNVQIDGTAQSTSTNDAGFFELQGQSDSVLLVFQNIGYEKKYLYINAKNSTKLIVALDPKNVQLNEVTIRALPMDTVYISQRSHVLDYDFYGENILLVTFGNSLTKSKLVLLNPLFDTLAILGIPEKPERLFKDCLGNNHLICATHVYMIYFDSSALYLLQPVTRNEFERVTVPCIAADSANLYFMRKSGAKEIQMNYFDVQTHNHVVEYFSFDRIHKKQNLLLAIADEKTLAMKADEEQFTGQKKSAGVYRSEQAMEADRLYAENAIYKEIFAPLKIIHDTIYVFDFINSRIACYAPDGMKLKQVEIKFHQNPDWK
ncbi:MAG: carboxypeptidase-like regulatory domain-containing protein, partial [Bacteroidia bacterium]